MLLVDWLKTVVSALNDAEPGREFHRYPLRDVVAYYNAAMTLVAKYRCEDFIEYTKVKLRPGKYQDTRQCCANVLEIIDQIDEHGNIIKSLSSTTKTKKNKWRKPSCIGSASTAGGFQLFGSTIDTQMNGQFSVDPPVPCDTDVWVMVKCVRKPTPITEQTALTTSVTDGDVHLVAAWHYILARLLTGDRHAGSADATATIHYKMFFELLGVIMKQEDALEAVKK